MKSIISRKTILTTAFSLLLILLLSSTVQAAVTNPVIGNLGTNAGAEDGSKFIGYTVYLWKVSVNLGALAVIAYFIWGAFEWITAGSDSKKTETARSRMTNAVIGLIILVSSFTLLSFISKVFFGNNFDLLKLTLPTQINSSSNSGTSGLPGATIAPSGSVTPAGVNRAQ